MYRETKARIWTKVIIWRLLATANSFMVLISALQDKPITNAILMNITGMAIYYWYERIWNNIGTVVVNHFDDLEIVWLDWFLLDGFRRGFDALAFK